jgi:hypothetical protein
MPAEYVPTDAQRALVESASAFGSGCPKWDRKRHRSVLGQIPFLTFNLAWMKAALYHLVDSGLFGTFIDWQALASI